MEIVKRGDKLTGFHVLPKRWIVERTFAWLNMKSSEAMIKIAMIRIMVRRLAHAA